VYEYIIGRNSDREKLVFDAFKTLERQYWHPEEIRPTGTTSIFRVSRQVHDEALAILYEQNTFFVRICKDHTSLMTVFHKRRARSEERYGAAMPYDWNVSRILHLCVGVEFCHRDSHNNALNILAQIKWTALPRMKSLRTLPIFMATYHSGPSDLAPMHNREIDGNGKLPNGTACYRQLMRNAIAHIRDDVEVSLGLDTRDEQVRYYELDGLVFDSRIGAFVRTPIFEPASFLEQAFEEFKGLRGVDVGCYLN
jgi:hypothetical protein